MLECISIQSVYIHSTVSGPNPTFQKTGPMLTSKLKGDDREDYELRDLNTVFQSRSRSQSRARPWLPSSAAQEPAASLLVHHRCQPVNHMSDDVERYSDGGLNLVESTSK